MLAVCLAAALVLAGCAGQDLSESQEKQVADRFEEKMSEIDGYHATMTTTVEYDNETHTTEAEVWARPGTGEMRQKVISPAESAGHVTVSNGSVMWSYDPDEERATRVDVPNASSGSSLVGRLGELTETHDIISNGTVTLDGTETYKLTLVPNESESDVTAADVTKTFWLDKEELFPVKIQTELGEDTTTTIRFTDLELNPGLSDERFEFEPPEGVEVDEPDIPDIEEYESESALTEAADGAVPDPDVPPEYSFEQATRYETDEGENLALVYTNGSEQLSISANPYTGQSTEGETVQLGDRTGTYDSIEDIGMVTWTCDDTSYSVVGSLDKEALVDVAASIDC